MTELDELCDEYFRALVDADPFGASMLGLPGVDDKVPDVTREGEAGLRARFVALRDRATALPDGGLDTVQRVSRAMVETLAQQQIDELDALMVEYSATPFFFGAQAKVLSMVPKAHVGSAEAVADYLTRCTRLPGFLDASGERLRDGTAAGRTAVAQGVADSIEQIDGYLALPADADPLLAPLVGDDSPAEPAQLDALRAILADDVRPAMARFRDILRDEILPKARGDERCGLAWLEGGDGIYRNAVRVHTTTERTPDELHTLGLEQVARLEAEYRELAGTVLGTTDLEEIYARLREDDALRFDGPDEIVAAAEAAVARAAQACPEWFGRLPGTPCLVRAMPEVEARGHTVAYYQPPGERGEAGTYWINTFGPCTTRYDAEAVAFHEAMPGHHLQVALAGELGDLPAFRRHGLVTAYVEGWGLYTERLADEMGLYSSDLARLGMLSCDSLRACRLVVDTGIHHLGWSARDAVAYMTTHSPLSREFVEAEVARYVVFPGQALGYMVGRLELLRMREEARAALGASFDIRGFHDTVLGQGAVPLDVLDGMVREWVARSR